ncbi:hypothetical protein CL629_04410 [bacterium]|nr:hypothetical protein [bacterium]
MLSCEFFMPFNYIDPHEFYKSYGCVHSHSWYAFEHMILAIFFIAFYFLIVPLTADAYIDPGTGSFLIQIVLATLLGASFTIKLMWAKIKRLFRRRGTPSSSDDNKQNLKQDQKLSESNPSEGGMS